MKTINETPNPNHKKAWFATWFNSHYYHTLYQHRNHEEAELFIRNLLQYLQAPQKSIMLDLACGKGRHAHFLNQQGYQVVGLDLAPESIALAQQAFSNEQLHFDVHDMRNLYKANYFDYIFNFFTSFGYFKNTADNSRTLHAIHQGLKKEGYLVIDFMNAQKVIANLVPAETKTLDNINFEITRAVEDGIIVKRIAVNDAALDAPLHFEERVQALQRSDFEQLLAANGFAIKQLWGNYQLQNFNAATSDRLIIFAQKVSH